MAEENKKLNFNADTGQWENLPEGFSIVNGQTYKVGDKYVAALDTSMSKRSTILLVQDKGSAYYTVTSRPKDADFSNDRDIVSAYFDGIANHSLLYELTMGENTRPTPVYEQSVFSKGMGSMGIQPRFPGLSQAINYAKAFKKIIREEERQMSSQGLQIVPYDNYDYSVPMVLKIVKDNDQEHPIYRVPIFTSFDYDMNKVVKDIEKNHPGQYETIVGDGVNILRYADFDTEEKMKDFCWKLHYHSMNKGDFSRNYFNYLSFLSSADKNQGKRVFSNIDNPEKITVRSYSALYKYIHDYCEKHGWDSDLNHIDVSKITDMSHLFDGTKFTGDISRWDVSNVKDMSCMFSNCKFNGDISGWNVGNVKDMSWMFSNSQFNQPIGNWDTSKVEDMHAMFQHTPFNQPLNNWNTSRVTDMSDMFKGSQFNQTLDEWDTSNVEDMIGMFEDSKFDQVIDNWDISSLSTAIYMFYNCDIKKVPNNWDLSKIEYHDKVNIFTTKVSFEAKEDLRNYIIDYCEKYGWDSKLNHLDVSRITDMSGLFKDLPFCGDLSNWNMKRVTDMSHMFENSKFNGYTGDWDVSNVRDMSYMFKDSEFNQSLDKLDTSNVTNMSHMFENSKFERPWLYLFTQNVTDMSYMFAGSRLTADLTLWNTDNVKDMSYMFAGAHQLENPPKWKLEKDVKTEYMFDSTKFEGKETTMKEKKYSIPEDTDMGMAHEPAAAGVAVPDYSPDAVIARIKARVKASMKVANVPLSSLTVSFASRMRDIYAKAKQSVSAKDLSAEFSCKYLLDNALTHAAKHDGLWLNTRGNTYPITMPYNSEFTHYGAVLAALYSERQGYPTNVFCGMEGLNKLKVLIKDKEIPHPIEVPMLGIDGTQMKLLYNIEQSTMEKDSPRQYARYNAKYSSKAKPDDLYIHKSFEAYERQKEDPSISMFRIGDKYMLFGDHASIVSHALGREGVYNRGIGSLTLTIPVKEMEAAVATLSSSNRKIALYDAKALYKNDPPSKLYDTFLPFIKDRAEKFGVKVEPCHHARSYYDSEKNTLYLRGADKATTPTKEIDKEKEASSILHALADMAQQRIGRQALGLDNLKPEDARKYSALLSEIAVGSQLLLRNIPARISEENMELIPYWKQQIRENPDMKKIIENGVNYIHDMMTDMNIRRYSRDLNVTGVVEKNPALLTITEDLGGYPDIKSKSAVIIRDKNKNYADVLLPSGASPVALEEISGMEKDTFISALAKEGIREVNFFNIHGYCAMRYPNLYYDEKQIEIVTVRDGKIVPRAQVDVKNEIQRTSGIQIENLGLLKNFNGRLEMYIVPKEGKPVSIEPTYNDIQEYFNAVKMTDKEAAMDKKKSLGVKYYNKALENPELQTDLLAPKTEGIESDRIKNINIVKNENGTSEIHVKIDNEYYKKPLTFDQYQRLWIVTDKEAYKLALTSVLFEKELGRKETQDESIVRESPDTEEKKPIPVEIQDDAIDGQDKTTEPDIEQDDKKEIRRGSRGR